MKKINIKNTDEFCFLHCINAAMFLKKHPTTTINKYCTNSYPPLENMTFNIINLKFQLPLSQIKRFEKQNPQYSINVFGTDDLDLEIVTYYKSPNITDQHVNLLLLEQGQFVHYTLIKSLSRLCAAQIGHAHYSKYHCD